MTEREREFQDLELLGGSSYEVVVMDTIWSPSFMWLGSLNMWIITQRLLHVRVTERERESESYRSWS